MISVNNLTLQYGKRVLFDNVNLKFDGDRCYGIIGANGAGKSTFLKIINSEIEPNYGNVTIDNNKRISVLKQNHFQYDQYSILDTVIMGHNKMWDIIQKKNAIYAKPDFNEEDGIEASKLEEKFEEMDGWNAESNAANMLSEMGIPSEQHTYLMKDVEPNTKVKVLLAQALFGNPDFLILDEPTNNLDTKTIFWLEEFLLRFRNTVIVVSHNRYFLDTVCTNIVDIDFQKIQLYTGNYSFWYQSSQLLLNQRNMANKKAEEKRKELQEFIARFSANASKSRQATSRKKLLDKINIEEIKPSSRKYPAIIFNQFRNAGNDILEVKNLSVKDENNNWIFKNLSFTVNKGDKIAFFSKNRQTISHLFDILNGITTKYNGTFKFGTTIRPSYLPLNHEVLFKKKINIIDWLREFSDEKDDVYIRSFLGKMLFSGEDVLKNIDVLSGGEKVRCMLSRMMLLEGNLLFFDTPTNHLDLESIQALNNSMTSFSGSILFSSIDHALTQSVANRIIEINEDSITDKLMNYNEFLIFKKNKTEKSLN
ncbi:MAG: ABC-F family ATPase [Flavobacteriales bacterium]|nr:ABC-F family ATPase [Flavobacteriales bacterium]|tara:strand:- start:8272 stop:9882 length:1611 start_codon:yes stop_codon:yes gene_type:complete